MKTTPQKIILCLLATFAFLALGSCERQAPKEPLNKAGQLGANLKTYEKDGFKVVHPAEWSLLHDEPGILADRTVAFETPEASRISVYFYKSSPRTYSELVDNLTQQLNLESSENVHNYQRESIKIDGFEGIKITWKSVGLSETLNEVTVLQIRTSPFPVFVQFHFFDDDIESQQSKILPFTREVTFDPQGI